MKIRIIIDDTELTATIDNNDTVRSFISMLPMTLTLEDYANTEKIFYPSRKLTTEAAPTGYNPSAGDITYYAPGGDIAIFYKDFGYASGLIYLGNIDGDIEILKASGKIEATFELIND